MSELDEITAAFQLEQEARKKCQSRMEKEKSDKQIIVQRLHSESSSNASRIHELQSHLEEVKKLVESREDLKGKREAARAARLELHAEKKALEMELALAKELDSKTKTEGLTVEDSLRQVDALRQLNDEKQAKQVLPGEREYESLVQQETELKSLIGDAQNDPSLMDLKTTIEELQQRLKDVNQECSELSAELDTKQMEKDERAAQAEHQKHSTAAEIEALQEEVAAVQESNVDIEKSISRLKRKIQEKSGGKELAVLQQKLRIFQSGADLLKKTAKKEKNVLNQDPDHFD